MFEEQSSEVPTDAAYSGIQSNHVIGVGISGFTGNVARSVFTDIYNANPTQYNQILSTADTDFDITKDWSNLYLIPTENDRNALKTLLVTDESKKAQDSHFDAIVVDSFKQLMLTSIRDIPAMIYFINFCILMGDVRCRLNLGDYGSSLETIYLE